MGQTIQNSTYNTDYNNQKYTIDPPIVISLGDLFRPLNDNDIDCVV